MPKFAYIRCLLLLTICVGCISYSANTNTHPTMGQEIMDLKTARDSGAMTDKEYVDARSALIARPQLEFVSTIINAAASQPVETE